ncbi:glycerophosphodiester phosphodiesterase [Kocuria sp. M1R5S2]|uniref:glycerophosphodiester phosphodiesterase n=1 Tax=Kocuria rhizosphaerae TaxID=3376285 RepID=UPI0037B71FED
MRGAVLRPGRVAPRRRRHGCAPFLLGPVTGAGLVLRLTRRRPGGATTPMAWPAVIAHRGGAAIGPENTLEAFRAAAELGDVVLELDAQTSADGRVVVLHDTRVDGTTDGHGAVAEMTLTELRRLDAAHRLPRTGAARWRAQGLRIPTLEEVYREFPDHRVLLDLKGDRPGTEDAVWSVIRAAGAQERTLVTANRTPAIQRFRRVSAGTVPTAASVREFAVFTALGVLGLHRLYRPPFQALQPPERYKGLRVLTPALVRRAHDAGLRVDVWTVDAEADMRRLLSWGVDGIMTDRPDVLVRLVGGGAPSPDATGRPAENPAPERKDQP